MPQIDDLRSKLIEHGARFAVVKNTLTRRAAEAAGSDALLALLEGPTAIAFLDSDRDSGAVPRPRGGRGRRREGAGRRGAGHEGARGTRRTARGQARRGGRHRVAGEAAP